jgi:serine/threonine-protein kinase
VGFDPTPGALCERYRLDRHLGRGGMGTVWSAVHAVTGARVALKLVHAPPQASGALRRRFMDEARAASAAMHPNVIRVHDVFELEDHTLVMVMDLLEGETLGARLAASAPLGVQETAAALRPVAEAVAAAHARGIVHRDLKPDNVFLAREDGEVVPKVLDFGIAKLADPERDGVTATGVTLGTPCYMAPEQGFGERDIDGRADVWALGVVLYQCLSGIRPLEADNLGQFLKRLMTTAIVPLGELEPDLPADLGDLSNRMLARVRDDRPSLDEVIEVLRRHETGMRASPEPVVRASPPHGPARHRLALAGLVAAGAAAIAGWVYIGNDGTEPQPSPADTATGRAAPPPPPASSPPPAPLPPPIDPPPPPVASSARAAPPPPPPPRLRASAAPTPSASAPPKPHTTPGGLAVDP